MPPWLCWHTLTLSTQFLTSRCIIAALFRRITSVDELRNWFWLVNASTRLKTQEFVIVSNLVYQTLTENRIVSNRWPVLVAMAWNEPFKKMFLATNHSFAWNMTDSADLLKHYGHKNFTILMFQEPSIIIFKKYDPNTSPIQNLHQRFIVDTMAYHK